MKVASSILLLLFALISNSEHSLVNKVIATVDGEIITLRDIDIESKIQLLLDEGYSDTSQPASEEYTKESIEKIIEIDLLYNGARKQGIERIDYSELMKTVSDFMSLFPQKELFHEFILSNDITMDELGHRLEKRVLADKFVKQRLSPVVRVTKEEIQKYYEKNKNIYKNKELSSVSDAIEKEIYSRKFRRKYQDFIFDLRRRADIRIF